MTSDRPKPKAGLGMNFNVGIHPDRGQEISEERPGIKRKNIVT